jgi:phosphate-selective porin OprO/OprP
LREALLEEEVRQLRSMVRDLSAKVDQLSVDRSQGATGSAGVQPGGASGAVPARPGGPIGLPDISASTGGSAAPRGPLEPRRTSRFDMPGLQLDLPLVGSFGPGFQLQTPDSEFVFQFHDLTQFDGRFYLQGGQQPVHSTFVIPRQWYIFSGRLTRPLEYYVALAEGIDNVNLLDAYLNIDFFDSKLQFKVGRYKTPFTYEFYNLGINSLTTPERSLFFNNFGLNRDLGMMAYGRLLENRFDYAVGIFNGTRNGYVDTNDAKDVSALVNFRPWGSNEGSLLENFSFGGSVDFGNQFNVPVPQVFRTNVATTGNLAIGPEFLELNNNVRESGDRAFWAMHLAYFYRHLSLISEWESGFQSYAFANTPIYHKRIPVQSYYVTAGYFLTGETASGRGVVRPRRNFDLRKGKYGPGAVEVIGRFNPLNIGRQIFTAGLADPNLWTNQLYTVDLGLNWYWNQFVKVYLGWQHAAFGDPVLFAPGRMQLTSDQFWLRFQVYF